MDKQQQKEHDKQMMGVPKYLIYTIPAYKSNKSYTL